MDKRSALQKRADKLFGMPLYYCSNCLRSVDVKTADGKVAIKRPCNKECGHEIIAPRRAIVNGKGFVNGLSPMQAATLLYWRLMAHLTGRCV